MFAHAVFDYMECNAVPKLKDLVMPKVDEALKKGKIGKHVKDMIMEVFRVANDQSQKNHDKSE